MTTKVAQCQEKVTQCQEKVAQKIAESAERYYIVLAKVAKIEDFCPLYKIAQKQEKFGRFGPK